MTKRSLKDLLLTAVAECDAVVISGGSSKDKNDITARVIGACGTVHIHGISLAPGKPTIVGEVAGKPVVGLPGHPAATCMVITLFIVPLAEVMEGRVPGTGGTVIVQIASRYIPAERGQEPYQGSDEKTERQRRFRANPGS